MTPTNEVQITDDQVKEVLDFVSTKCGSDTVDMAHLLAVSLCSVAEYAELQPESESNPLILHARSADEAYEVLLMKTIDAKARN